MANTDTRSLYLKLVRLGIGHTDTLVPGSSTSEATWSSATFQVSSNVDWVQLKALADKHELTAIVLDGLETAQVSGFRFQAPIPVQLKLKWIGEVLQHYEQRYEAYKKAISSLAGWYNQHGFKMMVLKGYGLSLNYPKPNHRPCGDIDIWLFGKQKEADEVLGQAQGPKFKIDVEHHHHTVFEWEGFTVENHYDFLNVHHHKSNVEMEAILKELGQDESHSVELNGEKVYLPSVNLHTLFMSRHAMSNFASTGATLRQLLDWGFFVQKHGSEIDWEWLEAQLEHFGMKPLFDIFNVICIDDLGFDPAVFPRAEVDSALKERVLNDILSPEFSEIERGGFVSRAVYKFRRWRANAWKHGLCFSESLWSAFWSGVKSHLLKPASI